MTIIKTILSKDTSSNNLFFRRFYSFDNEKFEQWKREIFIFNYHIFKIRASNLLSSLPRFRSLHTSLESVFMSMNNIGYVMILYVRLMKLHLLILMEGY